MSKYFFHKTLANLLIEFDGSNYWATTMVASKQYQRRRKINCNVLQLIEIGEKTAKVMAATYAIR